MLVVGPWVDQMALCYTHTHAHMHTPFLSVQVSSSSMLHPTEAQKTWMKSHSITGIPFAEPDMDESHPDNTQLFMKHSNRSLHILVSF